MVGTLERNTDMKIRFIDYPLMDRLAEIRNKLDGSKREVLLPEDAWLFRNIRSEDDGITAVLSAIRLAIQDIKNEEEINDKNPYIRAMLISLDHPKAPTIEELIKRTIENEDIRNKLIKIAEKTSRKWNIDNLEWQLVQGLQLSEPDQLVDGDLPVHRIQIRRGFEVLSALIGMETVRAWGYL